MISVLVALLVSGVMGMIGQGIRAIVGLKGVADSASDPNVPTEIFSAARLLTSLMIGFIAGAAAGLALGLDKVAAVTTTDTKTLLGLCAAGYSGTDFIEGFMARYLPGQQPAPSGMSNADSSSSAGSVTSTDAQHGAECLCDLHIQPHEVTADEELPPARGGVEPMLVH
jgi:putative chitinase